MNINQINISITNQFNFKGNKIVSISALLYDAEDIIPEYINEDTLLSIGYHPKNVISESYAFNVTSKLNNNFESMIYYNSSYYNYGKLGFINYQKQKLQHFQFSIIYRPNHIISKVNCGLHYSYGWGESNINKYRYMLGFESKLFKDIVFSMDMNYSIKFNGSEKESISDSYIKAYIRYSMN